MANAIQRRTFIQLSAAGSAVLGVSSLLTTRAYAQPPVLVSPGCRKSKVKVARIYLGKQQAHWPTPTLDIQEEKQRYEQEFSSLQDELSDVDFVVDELVSAPEAIDGLASKIQEADGLLIIQLTIGTGTELTALLKLQKPTVLFAAPYSGHEWVHYGDLMKQEGGELLECLLTSDMKQLAVAIRPFRAIHHLREAKVLDITSRDLPADFVGPVKEKFGTEIVCIDRQRVLDVYDSIPESDAQTEAKRWISGALEVVEPPEEEIVRSCRLALAFEKLLDEENATVITADCYGTMYHQLPAFPCIGFTRLNDKGLGGICESDLRCAVTHILFQGLSGKPGFISDPTMDESQNAAILAHCLGSTRMDGPGGGQAPYKIRTIMERQEGAVTQVRMRVGQKVTQAIVVNPDSIRYFTGDIMDTPDSPRGCRTKITVRVDGDAEKLWQNWSNGLHRVTCYGDITKDMKRFCRFKKIEMIQEA